MINLLSPDTKLNIRAARRNVRLRLFTALGLAVAVGIMLIYAVGFYLVMQDRAFAEQQLSEDRQAASMYNSVLIQAKEYKTNLSIAQKVLSTGMNYSTFLTSAAQALPAGSVLTNLTLSNLNIAVPTTPAAATGGLVLQARTNSYGGALQLKDSLEQSDVFENVSLVSVTKTDAGSTSSALDQKYPFTVSVNVTISKPKSGQ